MQVTIDSTESLDEVLTVLSTMFETRIITDPNTSPVEPAAAPEPPKTSKGAKAAKRAKGASSGVKPKSARASKTAPAASVDSAAVRAWARDNGTTVSVRGALSKSVVTAYQVAHA